MNTSLPDINQIKQLVRAREGLLRAIAPRPEPSADDRAYAQEVVAGRIRFNIATPPPLYTVGRRDIDWSGGHCRHQEWPTQMGRFFMLTPLLRLYPANHDTALAAAARDYISDWMAHFDCEAIEARGNTCMDIAIRLGTHGFGGWCPALATFMDDPAWDDDFIMAMVASIERQANILWRRAIPSRQWGNHRIFGLDGLLHTALRLPFISGAAEMVAFASRNLEHACNCQFMPDGSYVEQTLGYHLHMAKIFVALLRTVRQFPEVRLDLPLDRLRRAFDYSLHTAPGGINDAAAELRDLDYEYLWRDARENIATIEGAEPSAAWHPATDAVYPDAGQVFLRSSWERGADFFAFDASVYSGAHAHLGRLGIVWRSGGRLWVADPGSFDYEMSNPFAIYGRSTPAHTTLNLNGLNQGLGDARLLKADITPRHALLHGVYQGGYWSGTYSWGFRKGLGNGTHGRHERIVLWIRDAYLLVFDAMICSAGNTVEHVWQMAPVANWRHDPATLCWNGCDGDSAFHLQMVLPPEDVTMNVYEGAKDPIRGWVSPRAADGNHTPAPQIVFAHPAAESAAFCATLAMPLAGGRQAPLVRPLPAANGRGFTLAWPDGATDVVALAPSLAVPIDDNGIFVTDSPLVWARFAPDNTLSEHIVYSGNHFSHRPLCDLDTCPVRLT